MIVSSGPLGGPMWWHGIFSSHINKLADFLTIKIYRSDVRRKGDYQSDPRSPRVTNYLHTVQPLAFTQVQVVTEGCHCRTDKLQLITYSGSWIVTCCWNVPICGGCHLSTSLNIIYAHKSTPYTGASKFLFLCVQAVLHFITQKFF